MLTEAGPKLIEYNARFGDPECQVLMMRYHGDLAALMLACAKGESGERLAEPQFSVRTALTVVLAAEGYPDTPTVAGGAKSNWVSAAETGGAKVFQAGTKRDGDRLVASGGRVLNVTALGDSVTEAKAAAYRAVDAIDFADGFCRRDIGWREVAREAE